MGKDNFGNRADWPDFEFEISKRGNCRVRYGNFRSDMFYDIDTNLCEGDIAGLGAITPPIYGLIEQVYLAHDDKNNRFALVFGLPDLTPPPEGWTIIWQPDMDNPEDVEKFSRRWNGERWAKKDANRAPARTHEKRTF